MRFEHHSPRSARFVEIDIEIDVEVDVEAGTAAVVHRHGRIGTDGHRRVVAHASAADADAAVVSQGRRLLRKGFAIGHFHPALVRAIQAAPDDPAAYLVYGDWLLERQDPRGALIAAMHAGRAAEAEALFAAHPDLLRPTWWRKYAPVMRFERGFLREIRFALQWGWAEVRAVFRHPSAAVVREIGVELGPRAVTQPQVRVAGFVDAVRDLLPPTVRTVVVSGQPRPDGAPAAIAGLPIAWEPR